MAISSSFKQQCPSCEAMVLIRDPKLIGRKIDCPKCKYRFVVEEPVDEVDEAEDEAPAKKGKGGATGITKKPGAGKAGKRRPDDDQDVSKPKKKQEGSGMLVVGIVLAGVAVLALAIGGYFLFTDSGDDKPTSRPNANVAPPADEAANQAQVEPPKPAGPRPLQDDVTNLLPNDTQVVVNLPLEFLLTNAKVNSALLKTPGAFHEDAFRHVWGVPAGDVRRVILARNAEKGTTFSVMRTNSQLKERQIVDRLRLKEETINGLKYYLVQRPFDALSTFLLKLNGYHDKLALHFMDQFTVVCADLGPMNQFLQDKGQPTQLSRKPVEEEPQQQQQEGGGPPGGMQGGGPAGRPGGPRGGSGSMRPPGGGPGGGPPGGGGRGGSGGFQPPQGGPNMAPGMMPPGMTGGNAAADINDAAPFSSSYMTIDPQLKAVLDQVEKVDKNENQNVLLSIAITTALISAEDLKKILAEQGANVPEIPGFALKIGLDNIKAQLKAIGVAVTEFNENKIAGNVAVAAKDTKLAQEWEKSFNDNVPGLLEMAGLDFTNRNAGRNNNANRGGMQGGMGAMGGGMQGGPPGGGMQGGAMGPPGGSGSMRPPGAGMQGGAMGPPGGSGSMRPPGAGMQGGAMGPPGGSGSMRPPGAGMQGGAMGPAGFQGGNQPQAGEDAQEEKGKQGNYGAWSKDNVLALGANFNLKSDIYEHVRGLLDFVAIALRSEAAMSDRRSHIHELAAAMQAYFEEKGHFPMGAMPRAPDSQRFLEWRPDQRISWMRELLPYLANGEFKEVKPDYGNNNKTWYEDDKNIKAGFTVIPQFVTPSTDPAKPTYYVPYPNLPVKTSSLWAATHYVGMAGIGLDAAEYRADDPATAKLRGVFGYDRETKKADIKDGLDQTIVAIQVPPEPKSPWIAGGGSTVRGVSDDLDCVKPFVSTEYQGKRGTFAIMGDGKVRFIPATINPKTFQALCTIAGDDKVRDLEKIAPEVPADDQQQAELKAEQPAPVAKPASPTSKNDMPAGWQEINSKEGGYRVLVPAGSLQNKSDTQQFPEGKVTVHQFILTLPNPRGTYVVGYAELPPSVSAQVDNLLEGTRSGILRTTQGGKAVGVKKISLNGAPGQEFQVDIAGKVRMTVRAYVVKDRLYTLLVGGLQSDVSADDTRTFFDSFRITSP